MLNGLNLGRYSIISNILKDNAYSIYIKPVDVLGELYVHNFILIGLVTISFFYKKCVFVCSISLSFEETDVSHLIVTICAYLKRRFTIL